MAALCACSSSTPNVSPTTGPQCVLPAGVSNPFLVYPANGSTVAGSNVTGIYVATEGGPLTGSNLSWNVIIVDANNPQGIGSLPFVAVSGPPPGGTAPPYSNAFYQLASYGGPFGGGQTVNVYLNNLNSNCAAFSIGSFTTT